MTINRDAVNQLAGRIERAYRRRNRKWSGGGADQAIWALAASRLLEAYHESRDVPIDPEMYVAVLAPGANSPDPWAELTRRSSRTRYLKAVRLMIKRLRLELAAELRLADCRLVGGMCLDALLADGTERISPLTRYILASRAGRFDLVLKYRTAAQNQHRSCPLYRQASQPFLPNGTYPCGDSESDFSLIGQEAMQFSLN